MSITNDQIIDLLHQLVDALRPVLSRLDATTVPSMRVTLDERDGRRLVLLAGVEFEKPKGAQEIALPVQNEIRPFNERTLLP